VCACACVCFWLCLLFQASLLLKFVQMFFFSHFVGGCHFNDLRHLNEFYFGAGGQKIKERRRGMQRVARQNNCLTFNCALLTYCCCCWLQVRVVGGQNELPLPIFTLLAKCNDFSCTSCVTALPGKKKNAVQLGLN